MKKLIKKINNLSRIITNFDNKFQITKNSASLSFYILLSLVSVFLIVFQIMQTSNLFASFFLANIIDIFEENFYKDLSSALPSFSLSGFSVLLILNTFYSASKTINGYNRIADYIYFEVKNRVGWKNRLSAFLMFLMLLIVFLFELSILLFGNYLFLQVLKLNYYLVKVIQFVLEFTIIYFTINLLFIYAPPRRMNFKKTYKGSLFSTISIYLLLTLFITIINLVNKFSVGISILTFISYSLIVLFLINCILIIGLIINYYGEVNLFKLLKKKKLTFKKV